MSKLLDDLIQDRENLRLLEKKVTQAIKAERKAITAAKKQPPPPNKQMEMNKELRIENARLRGLIALLKRADGSTYKEVGELLGVSGHRAIELVRREQNRLRWEAQKEVWYNPYAASAPSLADPPLY